MAVALTVSAVAAYYSIIGLTAIFAAAVVPVIIMGASLEIAKITSAIWLHSFWDEAPTLTKTYLTSAVVILMFITSMGIFGFLSKAHIEQSAGGTDLTARIERSIADVERQEQTISRAEQAIVDLERRSENTDTNITDRIEDQERIIAGISERLARDIAVQQRIIDSETGVSPALQSELDRIEEQRTALATAQQAGDIRTMQAIVGANVDGVLGPNTRQRIAEYNNTLNSRRSELLDRLDTTRNSDSPAVARVRAEIQRLQSEANAEIARANTAIGTFRDQLIEVTATDNTEAIAAQEAIIDKANDRIDEILDEKFELENQLRQLEVEVGPVKYLAELVYGETNADLLEDAVRWVIIVLVLVFDPLAVVLVLAGISLLYNKNDIDKTNVTPHNDNETSEEQDSEYVKPDPKSEAEEPETQMRGDPVPTKSPVTGPNGLRVTRLPDNGLSNEK